MKKIILAIFVSLTVANSDENKKCVYHLQNTWKYSDLAKVERDVDNIPMYKMYLKKVIKENTYSLYECKDKDLLESIKESIKTYENMILDLEKMGY